MKSITELEKELQKVCRERTKGQHEFGPYGFRACKETIKSYRDISLQSLEEQYLDYITKALTNPFFNIYMVVACEEVMREAK